MPTHTRHSMGVIINGDTSEQLRFLYNPLDWNTEFSNQIGEIESPGAEYPELFYSRGEASTIQLTLEFHDGASVPEVYGMNTEVKTCEQVIKFLDGIIKPRNKQELIRGSTHFVAPPICVFVFGPNVFRFILQKYKVTRKKFDHFLNTTIMSVDLEMRLVR